MEGNVSLATCDIHIWDGAIKNTKANSQMSFGGKAPFKVYVHDGRVNELKPDLLVFGGDMTQRPGDIEKEWPALLKRVQVPFVVTPGNHDMGNRLTRENLERFRKVFGRDYGALDVKGWRVVAGNSQYWHKTEAKDEQAKYEAWLNNKRICSRLRRSRRFRRCGKAGVLVN